MEVDLDDYFFGTNGNFANLIDFEIKSQGNMLPLDKIQGTDDLVIVGYLQNMKKSVNFKVVLKNLGKWCFDYSKNNKGVWIPNKLNWYKLVSPSDDYRKDWKRFNWKAKMWLKLDVYLHDDNSYFKILWNQ